MTFCRVFFCALVLALVVGKRIGYDDSLDAFGVHGICGIWGALATGIFANPAITAGARGLLYGNPKQILIQFLSIIGTAVYSAIATLIVVMVTRFVTGGLRVDKESEIQGNPIMSTMNYVALYMNQYHGKYFPLSALLYDIKYYLILLICYKEVI